jgi:hypothetical protein
LPHDNAVVSAEDHQTGHHSHDPARIQGRLRLISRGIRGAYFDGTGDRIHFQDSADWEIGGNDIELTGWFHLSALNMQQSLVHFRDWVGNQQFAVHVNNANRLWFSVEADPVGRAFLFSVNSSGVKLRVGFGFPC